MTEIDVEFVEEIDAEGEDEEERAGEQSDIEAPEYVLYGGKGGVGKTTMAAATALASAREGVPTLVVSTDPAHSLSDVLDREIPTEPALVHAEYPLYGVEIDPDDPDNSDDSDDGDESQGDFFGLGSPLAGFGPFSENSGSGFGGFDGASDPFGAPMPGADEAAALRALLRYLDDDRFDRVVVDTAPTGHTLRLLELPDRLDATLDRVVSFREQLEGMFSAFSGGGNAGTGGAGPAGFPGFFGVGGFGGGEADGANESDERGRTDRAGRTGNDGLDGQAFGGSDGAGLDDLRELRDRLALLEAAFSDPERTDFRVVVVPEETSVVESRRLLDRLAAFDIPVGTIVVNRVMEDVGAVLDADVGHGVDESESARGDNADEDDHDSDHEHGDDVDDEVFTAPRPDSCPFCRRRLDAQMRALGDADDLFRGHSVKRVPLLASEVRGERLLSTVAACLA